MLVVLVVFVLVVLVVFVQVFRVTGVTPHCLTTSVQKAAFSIPRT